MIWRGIIFFNMQAPWNQTECCSVKEQFQKTVDFIRELYRNQIEELKEELGFRGQRVDQLEQEIRDKKEMLENATKDN
jgi:hypothetical protein